MKKAIVLGGGFAGVQTAIELQKSNLFDVTLISDRNFLFLYPISIWIPTDELSFENAKLPLSKVQKKYPFKVAIDKVTRINPASQQIECENNSYNYDYLVIAIGSDKLKHKGIENTLTICGNPQSTIEFRNKFQEIVKKGSGKIAIGFGGNPKDKSAVRGGPAFELIFNIHHYLKKNNLRDKFELTFFAPMEQPGARMGPNAMKIMDKMFTRTKLHKQTGKKITEFQADGIVFEDGHKLESDLTMFIAAGTGSSVFTNSDLQLSEAGFIKINDFCQVVNHDNIYAIGDSAALEGPEWVAKQGHLAEVMGRIAAGNIVKAEQGATNYEGYQEHLNILCVMDTGNGAAYVYRDHHKAMAIPLPIVGHWMKKVWGMYAKWTKTGKFPRIM